MAQVIVSGEKEETMAPLAAILKEGGHEVKVCAAAELLREAAAGWADLIMLSSETPDLLEVLRSLRQGSESGGIPVILALSRWDDATVVQGLSRGADEYLLPPFKAAEVLARVAVLLKLKEERRLLLSSPQEFARLFAENSYPLFYCDRRGELVQVNPSLRRLLGYPGKRREGVRMGAGELFYQEADRERFQQLLARPPSPEPVKVRLRHREGQPVVVLINEVGAGQGPEMARFRVQTVGALSPLKEALRGLVEHFVPAARDYLAILQMTPLLGGRYKKEKKLGQGSFGEVWLVLDTEAVGEARHYVAKIPVSKKVNAKFRKEAEVCRRLAPHPGAVGLVEVVEEEGKVVLIQEYVAGRTLEELLGEELSLAQVESIIMQLIEVVAHAHRRRIMHRDIKPNNIIIRPDGVLKLLDYGAAKILKEKDISATMVGSRPFMAPEQIMGKSERRSDIWAIGVIMYLLYTGELPFYHEVEKILIDLILEQEPTPPRVLRPDLPVALEKIILKCLKKKVEERYPSALALKTDLRRHFPGYGGGVEAGGRGLSAGISGVGGGGDFLLAEKED